MRLIVELLPAARKASDENARHVHQLRVATRRAAAVLWAMRPCIKPVRFKKMRARLRSLRRAAGEVRSADVHLRILRDLLAQPATISRPALEHALVRTGIDRAAAHDRIAAARRFHPHRVSEMARKLINSIREPRNPECSSSKDESHCFGHAATQTLARIAVRIREAASADLQQHDALHALRLRGKRLRYALEFLGEVIDPQLVHDLSTPLAVLHDKLGEINDWQEIAVRVASYRQELQQWVRVPSIEPDSNAGRAGEYAGELDEGFARLEALLQAKLLSLREECFQWWAGNDAARFRELLDAIAGRGADDPPRERADEKAASPSAAAEPSNELVEVVIVNRSDLAGVSEETVEETPSKA